MNKPLFLVLSCLSFLLLFAAVNAISSIEAADFVVNESKFIEASEEFERPLVPIAHGEKKYWVVPVRLDDLLVTFFPVKEETKALSMARPVNREIFVTADLLRELSLEKKNVSANPSIEWLFTGTYALRFSNLSNLLKNESFQLNTIGVELDSTQAISLVSEMGSILDAMSQSASRLAVYTGDASKAEATFFSAPDTKDALQLREKYETVISEISVLDKKALLYRQKVDMLKQLISVSSLEPSAKTYLISLADVPTEFNNIGNYQVTGLELSNVIESVYSRVESRTDDLLNEFDLRLQRQTAFNAIFGENASVKQKTNNKFLTISSLAEHILSQENQPKWKAEGRARTLETNWRETQKLFSEKKYATAKTFSDKVLADALSVFEQGFVEAPMPAAYSNDLIFQAVFLLAGLLVLLLIYNNRQKILGFARGNEGEGELGNDSY